MLDHPDLLLILARHRRDDLMRQRPAAVDAGARAAAPLRVSLARHLRRIADHLEPAAPQAGRSHA